MRCLFTCVLLGFIVASSGFSEGLGKEDIIKLVEDRITRVESYAVIFTIKQSRYTDVRGQVHPAYKKYALAARGPMKISETTGLTKRVFEEFWWHRDGRSPETQPTHNVSYYDGSSMYSWNPVSHRFATENRLNLMKIYSPPHYSSWLENIMVYPLHRFLVMKPCNVLMRDNKVDYEMKGETIEFQTEWGPNNRLKHHIKFHKEDGIKRIVESSENSSHEIVVDQYEEVNGVPIPARGRLIRDAHTIRMNMVQAKINDQVPVDAFQVLSAPSADDGSKQSDFPFAGDPTYFNKFFDLNLQEAYQKYMDL